MKHLFLTSVALVTMASAMANPIDSQQAQRLATQFVKLQGKQLKDHPAQAKAYQGSSSMATPAAVAYYIYNTTTSDGQDAGFVIISGDDSTPTVLGYSDQGSFSSETELPEQVQSWLDGYAKQINLLQSGAGVLDVATDTHAAVAPLLATTWGQNEPYYNQAPMRPLSDGSLREAVTGCVSTAMAQVMYYHKWPEATTTEIPAYTLHYSSGDVSYDALPATTFDWDNMLTTYAGSYSDAEANAVAELMRYTGQSVEMNYNTGASGASIANVPEALINYFDYSENTRIVAREHYTIADWDALIYSELAAGRPVIYSGSASDAGHMFVCDGYDGDGLYHINWGWNGSYNGYFLLSVLRPDGSGTGGSSTNDGYSMDQEAIVGVQPASDGDKFSVELFSSDYEINDSGQLTCHVCNYSGHTCTADIAWAVVGDADELTLVRTPTQYALGKHSYTIITFNAAISLSAGTYQLVPVYSEVDADQWQIASNPYDKIFITVNDDNSYSIKLQTAEITTTQFSLGTPEWHTSMYAGLRQHVTVPVTNSGTEYSGQLYIFYSLGSTTYSGDETGVAIETGATADCDFYVSPSSAGTYTFTVALDEDCTQPIGTFTAEMKEPPSQDYDITASDITFTAASETSAVVTFKLTNNGTEPYVNPTQLWLGAETSSGSNYYSGTNVVVSEEELPAGETSTYSYLWEGLVDGNKYWPSPVVYTSYNGSLKLLGSKTFTFSSLTAGVAEIKTGGNVSEQWYTLGGMRLSTRPTQPGVYIVNGKKVFVAQ